MKLFIDSAKIEEIQKLEDLGVIDGITTNPTLASVTGKKFKDLVSEIFETLSKDRIINLEVIATDYDNILKQARALAALDSRVVVKIPCIPDGLKACKKLSEEGIRVNITLVFSPMQALLCAKMGAFYVSPFVGRLDDISMDGMDVISEIVKIYKNYEYKTQILFASVRSVEHIRLAALAGVDIVTSPYNFIMEMYNHPLTDKGLAQFLEDWKNAGEEFIAV
jgi:transaldolase